MARISLKNIIREKTDAESIVLSFIKEMNADVWVEDEAGKVLAGSNQNEKKGCYSVSLNTEIVGWVKGDEKGAVLAKILNHLLQKESEKKSLGTEVLNLYREMNLIFNFSEKLSQAIEVTAIAEIALTEAMNVISSGCGLVLLFDESSKQLQVIASSGQLFSDVEKINIQLPLLLSIVFDGQSEIISDITSLTDPGIILPQVQTIIYSALKVKHRLMGAIILGSNDSIQYTAADLKLLTTLALQSSSAIESALLYEKNIREANEREEAMRLVYEVTGKFVPFEFIGSLGHHVITDVKLGDQVEKIVTVLFSDIRDYTSLSERMTPEENFRFVCSFNERMGPIIRRHKGFINQYLGDAIMAIFPGNASDALSAAIEMQNEVEELNKVRKVCSEVPIRIGVGMHTGPLIMGITGDKDRLDATTISDTVNTASRLESLTKHYHATIILSDACIKQIQEKDTLHLRYLGLVQLKGKNEALHIHECFNGDPASALDSKIVTLPAFNEGISHYLNNAFHEAVIDFQKVLDVDPNDYTAKFFYSNAKSLINSDILEISIGVVEMAEK